MSSKPKLIALSVGGSDRDLAQYGLGREHANELMVRLSRRLLQDGHRLAYGGTLRTARDELTSLLIDAAQGWLDEQLATQTDIRDDSSWPLVNYVAGPYHSLITQEFEAQLIGICKFIKIDTPGVTIAELTQLYNANPGSRIVRRHTANSLTQMREISAKECKLRIVWGGTIRGAEGWMAGIAEEVLFSLMQEKPVLILGGFGGCARVLADFIANPHAAWPEVLTLTEVCRSEDNNTLIMNDNHRAYLAKRYNELERYITNLKHKIHEKTTADLYGVPIDKFRTALQATSVGHAIKLAQEVAHSIV